MKPLLTFAALVVAVLTVVTAASAAAEKPVHGYRFITDTLGGNGGPRVVTVYRDNGFRWTDAGVGGAAVAGTALVLLGGVLVVGRRRTHLAV